eukprot:CAMPEP_0197043750 /NCGR_PEP_ID=MMETSP1384-20130603/19946_1 /TAXON_ID=29189 /ORGANISM="Ammonia sp." /LENGTH=493 /DNA_ID=CAMNT_0042475097 /DNA_START=15 /DNA_END=1496 /DNA_ORIENTATION=-
MAYPQYIQANGFERVLEPNSDEVLLEILESALKSSQQEVPVEIQQIILHFIPFHSVSDAASLIVAIENMPMSPPNFEVLEDVFVIIADKQVLRRVADLLHERVERSLKLKQQTMHPFWYYLASYTYYRAYKSQFKERCKRCFILVRELLIYGRPLESADDFIKDSDSSLPTAYGEFASSKTKHFACALLSHWYQAEEKELKHIAENALNELAKPMEQLYQELKAKNSPILHLELAPECLCADKSIQSNREAMSGIDLNWYTSSIKPWVAPEDVAGVQKLFEDMGLNQWDRVQKVALKRGANKLRKAEVMLMFYLLIAESINDDFQQCMLNLYQQNRKNMDLAMPSFNPLCSLMSPPIKTISRAAFKVKEDYKNQVQRPEEGSVLDWVRCAVVVESDEEMKNFFDLLCKEYSGCMVRMKNKFSPKIEAHFGYRVCMVNLLWTNKENPKLKMIVEVQLILHSYLPIRAKMHLFYKIIRSKNWRAMADDFAKFSDT